MRTMGRNREQLGQTVMRTAEEKMNYVKIIRLKTARQTQWEMKKVRCCIAFQAAGNGELFSNISTKDLSFFYHKGSRFEHGTQGFKRVIG